MMTSKELYSTCFREYILSDEKLRSLQNRLLEAFKDVKEVCDDSGIKYMLSGGSCLGAVRHKGLIPWDDDIDLMMSREDYPRFARAMRGRYPDRYKLSEPLDEGYFFKMPKLYILGTKYIEVPFAGMSGDSELFIDIFIIENAPENRLERGLRAFIHDAAYKISSAILDYRYPSFVIMEKARENREVAKYYSLRRLLGGVFSFLGGLRLYLTICCRMAVYGRKTGFVCIPSAISYKRELLPASVFDGVNAGEFCGLAVNLPRDCDGYLRNLYGDYMKIPPEDKRERHVAYLVQF